MIYTSATFAPLLAWIRIFDILIVTFEDEVHIAWHCCRAHDALLFDVTGRIRVASAIAAVSASERCFSVRHSRVFRAFVAVVGREIRPWRCM